MVENILYAAAPLIALTNPVTELPIFLAIMAGRPKRDIYKAAFLVACGVWLILMISAMGGLRLLGLFGIELPAFRAAGGLLVIVMGMEMLLGRETTLQTVRRGAEDPNDALWVPLIMPMLAGPGAMVTAVTLTIRDEFHLGLIPVATTIAATIAALVILLVLALAARLAPYVGARSQQILSRFAGLILVAIGFQMGFTGTADFFLGR